MSTMVTGGLGYVGRHLVARLARDGERQSSASTATSPIRRPTGHLRPGRAVRHPPAGATSESTAWSHHPHRGDVAPGAVDRPPGHDVRRERRRHGARPRGRAPRRASARRELLLAVPYGHIEPTPSRRTRRCNRDALRRHEGRDRALGRSTGERYGLEVVSLRVSEVYGPGNRMHRSSPSCSTPRSRASPTRSPGRRPPRRVHPRRGPRRPGIAAATVGERRPGRLQRHRRPAGLARASRRGRPRPRTRGGHRDRAGLHRHARPPGPPGHHRGRARPRVPAALEPRGRHPRVRRLAARAPALRH